MVGSIGLGGVQSFPAHPDVIAFIRWAIENFVNDVKMVSEDAYYDLCEDEEEKASADG